MPKGWLRALALELNFLWYCESSKGRVLCTSTKCITQLMETKGVQILKSRSAHTQDCWFEIYWARKCFFLKGKNKQLRGNRDSSCSPSTQQAMKGFTPGDWYSSVSFQCLLHTTSRLSARTVTMRWNWTHLAIRHVVEEILGLIEISRVSLTCATMLARTHFHLLLLSEKPSLQLSVKHASLCLTPSPLQEIRGANPSVLDCWCCSLPLPVHKAISNRHQDIILLCWESCVATLGPGQRRKTLWCPT